MLRLRRVFFKPPGCVHLVMLKTRNFTVPIPRRPWQITICCKKQICSDLAAFGSGRQPRWVRRRTKIALLCPSTNLFWSYLLLTTYLYLKIREYKYIHYLLVKYISQNNRFISLCRYIEWRSNEQNPIGNTKRDSCKRQTIVYFRITQDYSLRYTGFSNNTSHHREDSA